MEARYEVACVDLVGGLKDRELRWPGKDFHRLRFGEQMPDALGAGIEVFCQFALYLRRLFGRRDNLDRQVWSEVAETGGRLAIGEALFSCEGDVRAANIAVAHP